jgi:hypothetical protein
VLSFYELVRLDRFGRIMILLRWDEDVVVKMMSDLITSRAIMCSFIYIKGAPILVIDYLLHISRYLLGGLVTIPARDHGARHNPRLTLRPHRAPCHPQQSLPIP